MRRLLALGLLVCAAATAASALLGSSATGSSTYRVDAIFDTARGILPGQLVKIAGARVGEIKDVTLTPDFKARIKMQVDGRFAPFRSDATCAIKPEGLIAENFVQCQPGSPAGHPLTAQGGQAPTVPVQRTSVPVSINDLFNIWNVPTRDRLTLLVNDLGAGVAGRGEDINALLRRANPTLAVVRRTIGLLYHQRAQLQQIVSSTDQVVAQLAKRSGRVGDFIDQAARVAVQTGQRRTALAESIHRLPALLRAARPALARLDRLAVGSTPVLSDLRASAPGVTRLVGDLGPFSAAALPFIARLGPTLRTGRIAVRHAIPVVTKLRRFAAASIPTSALLDELLVSLRDKGFVEGLESFVYYTAANLARFDRTSHILPAHLIVDDCSEYAVTPVPGCSARYTAAAAAPRRSGHHRPAQAPGSPVTPAPKPTVRLPAPALPKLTAPPVVQGLQKALQKIVQDIVPQPGPDKTLEGLLHYLLK